MFPVTAGARQLFRIGSFRLPSARMSGYWTWSTFLRALSATALQNVIHGFLAVTNAHGLAKLAL